MNKKFYYAQLHLHTSDTSRCGRATGEEMAVACKNAGYDLIAVTDHFFNANIGCERELNWEAKVEYLFRGYYSAKKAGDKIGLTVLKGWETFQNGRELLTYGLDEEFLLAHPDIESLDYYAYIKLVHDFGGKLIHAHPYRQASYIPEFTPDVKSVRAFEVYNAGNKLEEWNELALKDARENGLLQFAGSDAHSVSGVDKGAMRFTRPVSSIHEIFEAAENGESEIIRTLSPEPCV